MCSLSLFYINQKRNVHVCSNRFDGIGRKSFCFFSHFIVVSSHWVFLIKYKDVWPVGMLEAMLLDDHLCVFVGYTGVM